VQVKREQEKASSCPPEQTFFEGCEWLQEAVRAQIDAAVPDAIDAVMEDVKLHDRNIVVNIDGESVELADHLATLQERMDDAGEMDADAVAASVQEAVREELRDEFLERLCEAMAAQEASRKREREAAEVKHEDTSSLIIAHMSIYGNNH